jgi:hypothetical protein
VGRHRRQLYVVPTKQGGYCWEIQEDFGRCVSTAAERANGFSAGYMGSDDQTVVRVFGDVAKPAAVSITVHYADGTSGRIPFIWVSAPIDAGFFSFDIPSGHQVNARRAISVTAQARDGRQLGIQTFGAPRGTGVVTGPVRHPVEHVRKAPRAASRLAPSRPIREETAQGFRVEVGANGAVQFAQVGETAALRRLAGHNSTYSCFRLTTEFGIFTVRSEGISVRYAPRAGFQLRHLGGPVDGCQVGTDAGHLWPDVDGSHDPAEIAFTPKGRAFFANRAAARDLALFVRTRHVQEIRHESPAQMIRDLTADYGTELAKSAIRMRAEGGQLVLSERGTAGRVFTIAVRDGRIAKQNVRPFGVAF